MDDTIHIKGLRELHEMLQSIPIKLERNVMRSALRQGMNVVLDEAKRNVHVSLPSTKNKKLYRGYEGALKDSLRVGTRSKRGVVTSYLRAGGKTKKTVADVYYATWVEYGTKAHWINSKSGWLNINGRRVKAPVLHPGAKPKPFLRPAIDTKSKEAVIAVGNQVKLVLSTKHGIDALNVDVGEI